MMKMRMRRLATAAVLACVATAAARKAVATTDTWIGLSGNWSLPGNWTLGATPSGVSAVITATGTGSSVVTYDWTVDSSVGQLSIAKFSSNALLFHGFTFDMETPGTILHASSELIGSGGSFVTGPNGTGTFVQNAGTNTMDLTLCLGQPDGLATGVNPTGVYQLGGTGVVSAANLECAQSGTGVFMQTGGTATFEFTNIGGVVGQGTGTVSISGGVFNAADLFFLSNPSNMLVFSGGTINTNTLTFNGGSGQFNWTGGTLNLTGDQTLGSALGTSMSVGANSRLNVAGNENIAAGFTLNLNAGGVNAAGNTVSVSGTLNANGGTIAAPTIMQTGGTIAGTLVNSTVFFYVSGTFSGRLVNLGTASFSPSAVTLANGVENDGTLTVIAGQTLTVNGAGMDNNATFTLVQNATINGAGPVINDYGGVFTGSGVINAPFTNLGRFAVSGVVTLTGGATNQGLFQGAGTVIGALANGAGGIIEPNNANGNPLAFTAFTANAAGGSISVNANQSVSFGAAWGNDGLVTLHDATAILNGKMITNTGTIQGLGLISAPITNTGVVRALAGELDLGGAGNANSATGQMQAGPGSTIVVLSGLSANSGFIVLSGGAFDNNSKNMTNSGTIEGNGTFRAGTLTNAPAGIITLADADSFIYGSLINSGNIKIVSNTTTFYGAVTNTGTIQVTSGVTRFLGNGVSMTVGGTYISDPSDNYFNGLAINSGGNVTGASGDRFYVTTGALTNAGTWKLDGTLTAGAIANTGTFTQNGPLIETGDFTNSGIATLSGTQTWSPGATFANAGTATLSSDAGSTSLRRLTITITAGTVKLVGPEHLQALSISGGKLDVQGDVFLAAGTYSTLASNLHSQAITTTSNIPGAAVALLTGPEFLALNPSGMRNGQQVLPTDLLLSLAYAGDTNLDGVISVDDYLAMDTALLKHQTNPHWVNGDFNYDNVVNAADYALIDFAYLHQSGPLADGMIALHEAEFGQDYIDALANISGSTGVPEPGSLLLLAAGALFVCRRR